MNTGKLLHRVLQAAVIVTTACAPGIHAQNFPNKPMRLLVPFSAGSGTDILARTIAVKMAEHWSQQVVVDNRPGAGGTVAAPMVINANHDGHTLMMVSAGHAANATLYRKLPYDTLKDFSGVSLVVSTPNVLIVGASLGAKTVKELIAMAKAKPGQFNYSSAGIGSGTHLNGEQFKLITGISATHIPFRGAPEALVDVVVGRVHFLFSPTVVAMPFIRDGRALALGVSTSARVPLLPNVPTLAEAGLADSDFDMWFGLLAPAKTPMATREKLSKEVARILQLPDVKDRLTTLGGIPRANTPTEFDQFIRAEVEKLGKIVKAGGAYAD